MHALDADRLAVGARKNRHHLAYAREFEPEHIVDENLAVEIGLGEAIGSGIELGLHRLRLQLQGVESGVQVPAHAIGADHHQRLDRIARCLLDLFARKFDAARLCFGLDFLADRFFDLDPIAVESGDEFAVHRLRPARLLPRRPLGVLDGVALLFLQRGEERAPAFVDRRRIPFVTRLQIFQVGGVAAIEE